MKKKILKNLLYTALTLFGFIQTQGQVFDFETSKGGWDKEFKMVSADLDATTGRNTLKCVRENNNATLALDPAVATIDPTTKNYLRLVVKNEGNATVVRVKANTTDGSDNSMQFNITANDTEFKTYFFNLDSYDTWKNATTTTEEVKLLFRVGYDAAEGGLFIDEMEFLTASATQTGILTNPSFDDFGGQIEPWSPANQSFATVGTSADFAKTGSFSNKHQYSAVPDATHFVFNNYVHDLGTSTSNFINASLWVKVVRPSTPGVSPLVTIQGQSRTGTTTVSGDLVTQSANKSSIKTDGTWEQLTYTYTPDAAYSTAQFRYGILLDNLQAGDIVYIDDLAAESSATASTNSFNAFEFNMFPNPAENVLNITTQENLEKIEIFNLLGKKVLTANTKNINISALSTSIYLVKLTSDKGVSTKKLVKN